MKSLKRIFLSILVLVMSLTLVSFSWEGELDPNDFDNWEVISIQPTPRGLVWMFIKNPDPASPIDIVAIATDVNAILHGYRYFKYGIPYKYVFDDEQEKYVRHHFTDEQRRSCMKCHSNKLVPRTNI